LSRGGNIRAFGNPGLQKKPKRQVEMLLPAAIAAYQRGQHDEARALCRKILSERPDIFDALHLLGFLELDGPRVAEAEKLLRRAVKVQPRSAEAHSNLGLAYAKLERFEEARQCQETAIALSPNFATALTNLGNVLMRLGQHDQAIEAHDRAIRLKPDYADAYNNRGAAFLRIQRLPEALASFDRALEFDPKSEPAWLGRANVLMLWRRLTEAKSACREALAINPMSVQGLVQLSQCHGFQAENDFALDCLDRALSIDPEHETAITNRIFWLDFSTRADVASQQAARADWWRAIGLKEVRRATPLRAEDRNPDRKIVLGYVSAEFKRRSAAFTYRPVLENHDKTQFDIVCYSNAPRCDDVTETFRRAADRWHGTSQWSDDQLADRIQRDGIDILVDLSGHGDGGRLRVFARKPAPIQVTAWGHATGTGLPTIDYLFSDPVAIPSDVRHHYAEQIYDLPCLIALEPPNNVSRSELPPVSKNGFLTYGVFNRVSKFSGEAIALWSRLLSADPACRLTIKCQTLDDGDTRSRLLDRFKANAVDPERILLLGTTEREVHLAALGEIDICLDPFPHGGGVSTWEALHMGVPVVTKLGEGVASRASGAILSATGLTNWVAKSEGEYFEIARNSTREQLEALRRDLPSLIDRRCGPHSYTRAVEDAYRDMWRRYCNA
jgi:predicted O-linked N-acetylglucosamine transferase (SPINDLY family)